MRGINFSAAVGLRPREPGGGDANEGGRGVTLRRPHPRGSSLSREEKRRIHRRRQFAIVLVLAAVGFALLMGTALGAAHLTSGSGVCRQCHEMQPYYKGWQQSAHKSLECAQCHIPSGTVGLVKAKIGALREVYVHFAGVVHMPLEVESTVPRATCLSCHPKPADATYATSAFKHAAHISGDCVDCHPGALSSRIGAREARPGRS